MYTYESGKFELVLVELMQNQWSVECGEWVDEVDIWSYGFDNMADAIEWFELQVGGDYDVDYIAFTEVADEDIEEWNMAFADVVAEIVA